MTSEAEPIDTVAISPAADPGFLQRYGATIDYRLRTVGEEQRNEFFVDMRSKALGPVEARLHLTS